LYPPPPEHWVSAAKLFGCSETPVQDIQKIGSGIHHFSLCGVLLNKQFVFAVKAPLLCFDDAGHGLARAGLETCLDVLFAPTVA
jgi:hypothetical protein